MSSNKGTTCHIQIKGEGKSRSEEIDLFPFVIGRGEEADIQIMASGISRSHISVSLRDNSLWIEDLGSANGTFLNDKKLSPKTPAHYNDGDPIRLGINEDVLTFNLKVEEKDPEHHAVVLPPIPKHVPETKEPLRVEIKAQAKIPEPSAPLLQIEAKPSLAPKPEGIKPLEGTVIDPQFQKKILGEAIALITEPASDLASKRHLEEAKAAALRIKITAETDAAKILQMAREMGHEELGKSREEAAQIVTKATDQAYRLQKEGEAEATKMRQAMQETISKVHSETEDKVEHILKEARFSATTIKGAAQTEAEEITSKAYQKALEIKNKAEEDLKLLQKIEKKKGNEIVEKSQQEADKILEEAHRSSAKIRENIDKEIDNIKAHAEKEAQKNNEEAIRAAILEAEKIKKEALKAAQKMSEEVLNKERANHLTLFEKENKKLAESLLAAQSALKKLEDEKGRLHDAIESYKGRENKILKGFEESKTKLKTEYDALRSKFLKDNDLATAKVTKEHEDFLAGLVKERENFKVQIEKEKEKMTHLLAEEQKILKEKAQSDFYLEQEALEAKYTKSRIKEISQALEVYILPRLKEILNWEEIPKPLNNFSSDLRDIVKKVLNGEFSEMVADTAMDTSLNHRGSSIRSKVLLYLTVVSGLSVLALMAFTSWQDPTSVLRKPASEAHSKAMKPIALATTDEYKSSYTDNVLYTKGYVGLKLNQKNHEIWKTEIDNFFTNDLGLKKTDADRFIETEFQLVLKLAELRAQIKVENKAESVQRMATLEKLSLDQIIEVLKGQENYNSFRDFEKNYIERNRTPASQD